MNHLVDFNNVPAVGWQGQLDLHDRFNGSPRVLQPLYPEGHIVCHNVLVQPPGGVVGGDVLRIEATLDAGTHDAARRQPPRVWRT